MPEHTETPTVDPMADKYRRFREVQRALNRRLITMLPKNALKECAEKVSYDARVDFTGGDDISVLVDYAIYDYRIRGGTNAVERLVKQAPWPAGTDEHVILDAMQHARFTVLCVSSTIPDIGVRVQDLFYEREFLLTDVGLSKTATEDQHIIARVLEFPEFHMTTGAALPFDRTLAFVLVEGLRRTFPEGFAEMFRRFKVADYGKLAAQIIEFAMEDPGELLDEAAEEELPDDAG
jgi:hypothetical protein